jgi:Oxidoreductase-like protein, N-terminal
MGAGSIGMPGPAPDDDPPPIAPAAPAMSECCRGGCDPCIFDLYEEELVRYEAALREWEQRRKGAASIPR